jgi:hypothetical protein
MHDCLRCGPITIRNAVAHGVAEHQVVYIVAMLEDSDGMANFVEDGELEAGLQSLALRTNP